MGRLNGKPLRGVRKIRARAAMNQKEFWNRVGVTQSGGSRYESGRRVPKPVRILLDLAYGKGEDAIVLLAALRQGVSS